MKEPYEITALLLTKEFAKFFLVLVVVFSELRRNGEKLEIFRLHLGVDARSGWSSTDCQDNLLPLLREHEVDE